MKQTRNRIQAFTIMELLVVMAIIGVLAGILFPIFARAKESGYKASALLQAKQLGTGLKMYADEHDGHMVPSTNYGLPTSSGNRMWTAGLKPYVKEEKVFIAPGTEGKYTETWDQRGSMSIGYSSATAVDKSGGCPDDVKDSSGCQAFKSSASFDSGDNLSAIGLFAVTPPGEVSARYLGYEFSPYTGTPVPGLDNAHQPPLASDIDLIKESPTSISAEMLKPIWAKYGSDGRGAGVTPVIFGDTHAKGYSATQILGGSDVVWRFR